MARPPLEPLPSSAFWTWLPVIDEWNNEQIFIVFEVEYARMFTGD
jgi:hypothetical protein